MTLGQKIRSLRESRGLSMNDLSKIADFEKSRLCYWENDKCQPNIYNTKKLAEAFNITIDELLEGVDL